MIKMTSLKTGPVGVNTYIVYDNDTNKGFIVDPGGNEDKILSKINELGIEVKDILLTHGHFDHCGACAKLQKVGMKVYIHNSDAEKLISDENMSKLVPWYKFEQFEADEKIVDGQVLEIGGIQITVLHTPGHTSGGVCYIVDKWIFSGDTLFKNSIGRADLSKSASHSMLVYSIKKKLFALEGDYDVYPGHESFTTLNNEKQYNPYLT